MTVVAVAGEEHALLTQIVARAGLDVGADLAEADAVLVGPAPPGWGPALDELRRATRSPLIAVCPEGDPESVHQALSAGADGIMAADSAPDVLAVAIAAARAGQLSVPRSVRRSLETPSLTARERQILGMIVLGLSNGDIAQRLGIEQSTVKTHVTSSFAKLGVGSRSEATAMILDPSNGLGPGILSLSGPGVHGRRAKS